MKQHTIEPEDLDWLGGLALALVGERHAASDLVQDALATAVQHPDVPREHRRGWYRTVLRRLAASRFRREALRADREAAAARPEAELETAERVVARDLAERLADAVRALDEPYRRALLLRFHEDLDAAEIARREGLTADAVRRRVRHGLGLLREELLRRDARGWREWRAALVPLATGSWSARSLAGPGTWALRAAGVALLAGAIVVPLSGVWNAKRSGASAPAVLGVGASPQARTAEVGEPDPPRPLRVALPALGATDAGSSKSQAGGIAPPGLPASGIRGRLLAPDGTPAVGVGVHVNGWASNQYSSKLHGSVEDWVDPEGFSNEQGVFEFRFDPPPAHWFTITTEPGAFAQAAWRFSELDTDSLTRLRAVKLLPTGSLRLRLLDDAGAPFPGRLTLFVDSAETTPGPGGIAPCVRGYYDPSIGELLVEGLAEGAHSSRIYSDVLSWMDGPRFRIKAGAATQREWTLAGKRLERSIAVSTQLGPASPMGYLVSFGAALVREADGKVLEAGRLERHDLEPGTYKLEFDHPWFIVESNTGLETGRSHVVPVRGSAQLDLRVLDGRDGQEVRDYSAWLRYVERPDNLVALRTLGKGLQQGPFEGIVPTPLQVEIDAGELGTGFAETSQLSPGQTTTLVVELGRPTELEVQVRSASSGTPLEGREVVAMPKEHGEPPLWSRGRAGPPVRAVTDAAGSARLELGRAESVWVATRTPPGEVVERLVSPIGSEFETVVFEVEETVSVSGVVKCVESLEGWTLELTWKPQEPVDADLTQRRGPYDLVSCSWSQDLGPEGRLGLVELGPGRYGARLSRPLPSPVGSEHVELGVRDLRAGESGVEWIFEASLPARGRVVGSFLVDGEPAAGAELKFIGPLGASPPVMRLDETGHLDAEVMPGAFGLYLQIGHVLGADPVLTAWLPDLATVVEGETVDLGTEVTTAMRGLRLMEADGTRVRSKAPLRVVPADSPPGTGSWTMGGWPVEPHLMWLPVGRYRVERSGESIAEFDWEAGEGPVDVRVGE